MFDLEFAIASWRAQLDSRGIKSGEALDELEGHLREEIERRVRCGSDAEHAFSAAIALLGTPTDLSAEFAKVPAPGALRFLRAFYFGSILFMVLVDGWTLLEFDLTWLERLFGMSVVLTLALCLAKLPWLMRSQSPTAHHQLGRRIHRAHPWAIGFTWLWVGWELLEAENVVHLRIGILATMILWSLCAAIGLGALAYGLHSSRSSGEDNGEAPPAQPKPQLTPPTPTSPADYDKARLPRTLAPIAHGILESAGAEASRFGHDFIGTEHLLLGMLRNATSAFSNLLRSLSLDEETVRLEVESMISSDPLGKATTILPFTPRARRALRLAAKESKRLKQRGINMETVFLGLLIEGDGVAGRALRRLNLRIERTREHVLKSRSPHPAP